MTRYGFLTAAKRHIPQKVRFVIGMFFIFPFVAAVVLVGTNARLMLALWDMVKDAYNGDFQSDLTTYVTDRMNE